ncbi:MAG: NAD(P)/FAD-dependent oxidoreductase [Halioglobus sp.]
MGGEVACIIIGAGQAGLATSRELYKQGIDHLILERGEVANTWKTERWESLRLLSPNRHCQLPDRAYNGEDPNGFMGVTELVGFLEDYAQQIDAPVVTGTTVLSVTATMSGYKVVTDRGVWHCRTVVIASGCYNIPVTPRYAQDIPDSVACISSHEYRNPGELADGGVLVVGASATGLQIAREIHNSGRSVTVCVGEHVRLPRRYRGRDIFHWMDVLGLLDEGYQEVDDIHRARRVPSAQLVGSSDNGDLDLNTLRREGVQLVGRLAGVHNGTLQFSGALANVCKMGDLKMNRLLQSIDDWIVAGNFQKRFLPGEDFVATDPGDDPRLSWDLAHGEIKTIVWACGFRPDYSWLKVPVLDRRGRLCHDGGVTPSPGLYAMGLPFMRRRKSSFIYGVSDDARDISAHLSSYLAQAQQKRSVFAG